MPLILDKQTLQSWIYETSVKKLVVDLKFVDLKFAGRNTLKEER